MLVVDILEEQPLDLEVTFELESMILPPERKGLIMVARSQSGHTFKHPALHHTEEQVGIGGLLLVLQIDFLQLLSILGCSSPDPVLYSLDS